MTPGKETFDSLSELSNILQLPSAGFGVKQNPPPLKLFCHEKKNI